MSERLLLISNRLPVAVSVEKSRVRLSASAGGLATGLRSFYEEMDSVWIGWPGLALDRLSTDLREKVQNCLAAEYHSHPVALSDEEIEGYYYGFCNKTIWPLFHYFTEYVEYDNRLWRAYERVNEKFADAVIDLARPGDFIWVHDYQLMLLPALIRDRLPTAHIAYFHHIPFPSFELFRTLPWKRALLDGLLGADLIGFHTYDYVRHFLSSVRRVTGFEHNLGNVLLPDRVMKVDAFPMGIDYDRYFTANTLPAVRKEETKIRKTVGRRKIILSIDRLDYSKGVPERLVAFDLFLDRYPEFKNQVTLVMVAVPTRSRLGSYKELKRNVDELVGQINGKHASLGWSPIWYLYRSVSFPMLAALYTVADIALVNPLRDGMNLVAKEFVASRFDQTGVLILSEMAGAEKELGEALIVNPHDVDEVAEAIATALEMPLAEQVQRNRIMQGRLRRYHVLCWANHIWDELHAIKKVQEELHGKRLVADTRNKMCAEYRESHRRLIMLDYDGTLTTFASTPDQAVPDEEILNVLSLLANDPGNELVIISGRDRESLERMFGGLPIGMVSDHGVSVKEKDGAWRMVVQLDDTWKAEIRPVMEQFVDRTPGTFVEEKDFSLAFHYRKADAELAAIRVSELIDNMVAMTAALNLGILEGNKVIEIKNTQINKGQTADMFTRRGGWDFIMAIGDDWTDEDMFSVLPADAYTVKVGLGPSKARFCLESVTEVRELLKQLTETCVCPA